MVRFGMENIVAYGVSGKQCYNNTVFKALHALSQVVEAAASERVECDNVIKVGHVASQPLFVNASCSERIACVSEVANRELISGAE